MPEVPYAPYMQTMNMPTQYAPMVTMPQQELEAMYPKIYFIIYPCVCRQCDMAGTMAAPTKEQLETMTENIVNEVEPNVAAQLAEDEKEGRQLFFGTGRRFLRDLAGILLIRELIRRRPFYGYSYPGIYGYPGVYGYPGTYGYPWY